MTMRRKDVTGSGRKPLQQGGRLQRLVDAGDTGELARRAMTLQNVLLDLHRQLGASQSPTELARTLGLALTGSFACERLLVLRRDSAHRRFEAVAAIGAVPAGIHAETVDLAAALSPFLPHVPPLSPLEPPIAASLAPCVARLVALGFERAAWLNVEKQVDWLVLVGPKLSGASYDEFDASLLRATFDATTLACSRLLLVDALEERNRQLSAANARLLQIDELKSAILNGVGDELRTPLARALSYAEALRDDEVARDDANEFLDVIIDNTRHLASRIDQALRFANLVDGRTPPHPERVELQGLVETLAERRQPDADARSLHLVTASKPLAVHTDPAFVSTVVECLLDNAIRFTPAGGTVRLEVETWGAGAEVRVSDTGAGIPEEARDRIWRLFETGDLSLRRERRGWGIGLAMAKRLASDLGLELELVRSDASGSVFALRFEDAAAAVPLVSGAAVTAGTLG
jgi:signal transduction histidine kinase